MIPRVTREAALRARARCRSRRRRRPPARRSESPSSMVGRSGGVDLDHREVARRASCPSTVASRVVPSENTAWICWAPSTTWLLVTITPSDEIDEAGAGSAAGIGPAVVDHRDDRRDVGLQDLRDVAGPGDAVGRAHDHRGGGRRGGGRAVVVDGEVDAGRDQGADEPADERGDEGGAPAPTRVRSRRSGGTGGGGPTPPHRRHGRRRQPGGPIGVVGAGRTRPGSPGAAPIGPSPARPASRCSRGVVGASLRVVGASPGVVGASAAVADASPSALTANADQPDGGEWPALPPSPRRAAVRWGSRARDPPPGVGVVRTGGKETSASNTPFPEPRVSGT